jgi:hypothetical protein
VAIWFLIVDSLAGRPFYTPAVLGTALFGRGAGLDHVTVSLDLVAMFTWVHGLAFAALGGIAARLLAVAERNPSLAAHFTQRLPLTASWRRGLISPRRRLGPTVAAS